jgi:hypothetical protein
MHAYPAVLDALSRDDAIRRCGGDGEGSTGKAQSHVLEASEDRGRGRGVARQSYASDMQARTWAIVRSMVRATPGQNRPCGVDEGDRPVCPGKKGDA